MQFLRVSHLIELQAGGDVACREAVMDHTVPMHVGPTRGLHWHFVQSQSEESQQTPMLGTSRKHNWEPEGVLNDLSRW